MTPDQIAPVVHEAIRTLQTVLGQNASPPWSEATWERASTLEAVRHALDDPTPGKEHERWMRERLEGGWRYGPVRDEQRKLNPTLVPFDELPAAEKAKDALVIAITQSLKEY